MIQEEVFFRTDAMLHQAIKSVDALFGEGYAKEHPEIVAGFMVSASNNAIAMSINVVADELAHFSAPR